MKIVREQKNRRTGTTVLLIDNRDESFEEMGELLADGRWATCCETHGNYVLHSTRKIAESFLAVPDEYCEQCADELGETDEREWTSWGGDS